MSYVYSPSVFREYDIRGFVDKDLSDEFSARLGCALARFYTLHGASEGEVVIGYDARASSKTYADALAKALSSEGFKVTNIGLVPTPVIYHYSIVKNCLAAVVVTGSHNPKDMNGFKLVFRGDALYGEQIQYVRKIFETVKPTSQSDCSIFYESWLEKYAEDLANKLSLKIGSKWPKFAADFGNGVAGLSFKLVASLLGVDSNVVTLFEEPDPNFPNHHPDPTVETNLTALKQAVIENSLDFGVAFDGDGDRIGLVDKFGRVVPGDMILLILAKSLVDNKKGLKVVADVKCSDILFQLLTQWNAQPLMWKTGHSLIKAKMKETGAELGGEMSGHIFIKDRFYGFDDAVYACFRLLEFFVNTGFDLSAFIDSLPKTFSTPEIRLDVAENLKFQIVERVKDHFLKRYDVVTIDGARIRFEKGWGLIRASNTQPVLVLRFEAKTEELLNKYKNEVLEAVEFIKNSLG